MKMAEDIVYGNALENLAWISLAESFRRACSLYHEGFESDAMKLAQDELPQLIAQWSNASSLAGGEKRQRLISLFIEEGRRIGEVSLVQKMLSAHINAQAFQNRKTREMLVSGVGMVGGIIVTKDVGELAGRVVSGVVKDEEEDLVVAF